LLFYTFHVILNYVVLKHEREKFVVIYI